MPMTIYIHLKCNYIVIVAYDVGYCDVEAKFWLFWFLAIEGSSEFVRETKTRCCS